MSNFSDRWQIVQQHSDRSCGVRVGHSPAMPDSPIVLDAWVEFDHGEQDMAQTAFSIDKAKALQHALLAAINEAERGQGGPA